MRMHSGSTIPRPTRAQRCLAALGGIACLASSGQAMAGSFSEVIPWESIPIHAALLPNGKVMTFGASVQDQQAGTDYILWDPTKGVGSNSRLLLPNGVNFESFCAGGVLRPSDGTIMIAGGRSDERMATYDYTKTGMTMGPSSAFPRYYASLITLPDGRLYIHGGSPAYGTQQNASPIDEIYTPGQGWTRLPGTANSPMRRADPEASGNPFWYPHIFPIAGNKIFSIGGKYTYKLDYSGNGSFSEEKAYTKSNWGASSTAVMYRPGLVMQIGGGARGNDTTTAPGSNVATIMDLRQPNITMRDTFMSLGRHFPTATLLANGEVLVTGGSRIDNQINGVASQAEIYNPDTETWRVDAAMKTPRLYHSIALLLKDGRVLVGGGGAPGPVLGRNVEIYSPDYLKNGAVRPQILAGPTRVALGQDFQITADKPIKRVTLVKTGVVTHGFNSDQRFFEAAFVANGNAATITFPNDAVNATPGLYMVFAFDSNGVPSVGKFVRLPSPIGDTGFEFPNDVSSATPTPNPTPSPPPAPINPGQNDTSTIPLDGTFTTLIAQHSNQCLTVKGSANTNGTEVVQSTCTSGNPAQRWRFVSTTGGHNIINERSGRCLDIRAVSTANGAAAHIWDCWGGANQAFTIRNSTVGPALVAAHSGKCLDVSGGSMASGANVIQWDCHGGLNQSWGKPKGSLVIGSTVSFVSVNYPTHRIRHENYWTFLKPSNAADGNAKFIVRAGLGNPSCFTFEAANFPGHFLRHWNYRIRIDKNPGVPAFLNDATFCTAPAENGDPAALSLKSLNLPSYTIRHRNFELWLDQLNGSALAKADSSLKITQ